ncbi:MAG: retropepsin-like aspartic protease [Candidatus Sulfotelmatobacter sp.]
MTAMRYFLGLICCLSLSAADVTQLRQFQENSQFFQLREALQRPGWNNSETLFYGALVESRFGQDTAAIKDLKKFLAAPGQPFVRRKAYEELASALGRVGRYGDSAHAMTEALRLTPFDDVDRAGEVNTRTLYESLADVAPQTVEFGEEVPTQASFNPLGSWDVPVEVNGHQGAWIFDTGANLSTVSESEAAKMGLAPRETSTYVNGSTGKKNPLRLAVARDLRVGSAHLSNVVFLVISDQALFIDPLKYQIRGILGLPVLRALGCVAVSAKGVVRIETKEAAAAGNPNLFLDGWDLIVEVRHGDRRLQMFLDTGANSTSINPSFRDALMPDEIASLKSKRDKTGGAGGVVSRKTEVIPTLRLEILGRAEELTKVSLLLKQPAGDRSYRDGVLGMDGLAAGFTLDLRAMQLRLD